MSFILITFLWFLSVISYILLRANFPKVLPFLGNCIVCLMGSIAGLSYLFGAFVVVKVALSYIF